MSKGQRPARAPERPAIRYIMLEDSMPTVNLRRALAALFDRGEQLSHLGTMLNELGGGIGGVEAERLRHVATGVRASATHAMLVAANAVEIAGRIDAIAAILESDQSDGDAAP